MNFTKNNFEAHFMFFIFIFLSFCTVAQSAGLIIYVAPSGNDNAPGTLERPLATPGRALEKLAETVAAGRGTEPVEVIVADGIYYLDEPLRFVPTMSGSPGAPVVIKAEEGAHPVFCGGRKIEGFEKVSETLWRVKIPETVKYGWRFEQLYVNGHRAVRAQSPNTGFYRLKNVTETVLVRGNGRAPELAVQRLEVFPNGAQEFGEFTHDDFEDAIVTFYHKWDNTRKPVLGFQKDSMALFIGGKGLKPWNTLDAKTRYTIGNYHAALDTCGEWFLDRSGYLFYMPLPGETPGNIDVVAPVVSQFLVIQGDEKTGRMVENIRFEGLSFQVSGYRIPGAGNEPAQAASPVDATVVADFVRNIQFMGCEIAHTGTYGIWFRRACSSCTVQQCYLHDLGAGGLKIGETVQPQNQNHLTRNILVDNNIIRSGGYVFPCAVGVILFHTSDNAITHNEIADFRYSGVSVGWVWGYTPSPSKRNKIEFNHIHHLGWGELCDMGGVYCLGESEGTTVSNNVIHHVYSYDYGGWGLYTDEGSTGILMENNLVYQCKNSGFHQHYGKENIIRNNIFAGNMKAQLQATRVEEHLSFTFTNNIVWYSTGDLLSSNWDKINIHSDKNCFWDTRTGDVRFKKLSFADWQKAGKDVHSIIADPKFANPAVNDFRITNKAVLRKTGFKEFDYAKAGVYGDAEWKKLAEFDPAMARGFDEAVIKNENRIK
jgi:parallel beta-helix repeat protein